MSDEPVSNGPNGQIRRNTRGQFVKGSAGGPGNPHVQKLATWRAALSEAVSPEILSAVIGKLVEAALAGESWAVKELLDRTLGRPVQAIVGEVHTHAAPVMSEEDIEVARRIVSARFPIAGQEPEP